MSALSGTHVAHQPGDASQAEDVRGLPSLSGKHLRPPLATWMADPRRGCRDKPTNWWYGSDLDEDGGYVVTAEQVKRAEELCRACPFELDCADYGLRNEPFGMWGGIKLNGLTGVQRADRLAGVDRERRRRTP